MKALLVYPDCPETFWSFNHALKFIGKKASQPPLGLLTVASMLIEDWDLRLVDMRVEDLTDSDLDWAEVVFISALSVQRENTDEVIHRCRNRGLPVVAGGPLFTAAPEDYENVDHLILGEAENLIPTVINDFKNGQAGKIYQSNELPDLEKSPVPRFDLLNMNQYAVMSVQYSRGCPFDCEFCDVPSLMGRKVRSKTSAQIVRELDTLYKLGWKGSVAFADDNFNGNHKKLKEDLLPAVIKWQGEHGFPFVFHSEASITMADDPELMDLMVKAGYRMVFLGIETPNEESLDECGKTQNVTRDLRESIRKIQKAGMQVAGGFILGFDSDTPDTFDELVTFIQELGIVIAMVGLLNAVPGSKLMERLRTEGRLLDISSSNNTDMTLNYVPSMGADNLLEGYRSVLKKLYASEPYYDRVWNFLKDFEPSKHTKTQFEWSYIPAALKVIGKMGFGDEGRGNFWRLFCRVLFNKPKLLPQMLIFIMYGLHFREYFMPMVND